MRARFADTDTQFKAKALLESELNTRSDRSRPTCVAFNLLPNTPLWLQSLHALPMYLGLDLRGGVHFLMQVDTKAVLNKRLQGLQSSARSLLRDKNVRHAGIDARRRPARNHFPRRRHARQGTKRAGRRNAGSGADRRRQRRRPETDRHAQAASTAAHASQDGVQQNITTLSKRVNELGVAEPVIQRQGADRIVVQLPGVQDVARAKDIIGRTATLEVRMVDESVTRGTEETAAIPFGSELFKVGKGAPVVLYKEPIITGDYISNASASFDQNQQPAVSIDLNGDGGRKMRQATRDKIGKAMAIVLFEKGKGEVLTVATIRDELGSRFQITGMGSAEAASDLALLLRAGSLAAPMEIIEERTIGPQLGADNIHKGFDSTLYGFIAIVDLHDHVLPCCSASSACSRWPSTCCCWSPCCRMLQATLTLPGIAAIALTLGMAIDANVLINERIREELRAGTSPQAAISHRLRTRLGHDSRLQRDDADRRPGAVDFRLRRDPRLCGGALPRYHDLDLLVGVRVARLVNLWYGRKKKLAGVSIGHVWKPNA